MEHLGSIVAGVPTSGCECVRCVYLRAIPNNPDHIGDHIMDKLDASNEDCPCARCDWLRKRDGGG